MMRLRNVFIISLLVSTTIFSVIGWPLPKYLNKGIPVEAYNRTNSKPCVMLHGDHLQLLYHFWLWADYLTGKTPFFYNLYEFNLGDDEQRFHPRAYHFPFPLIYKIGERISNRALGYNLTLFLTFWMTYFTSWLLLRRYRASDGVAALAALFSIVFPYKWFSACSGSPTGFGLMWLPMVWLGMDIALREKTLKKRLLGSSLAGVMLLFLNFCDSHVFYFTLLHGPFLFLFCALNAFETSHIHFSKRLRTWSISLLPLGFFFALSIAYGFFKKHLISQAIASGARGIHAVRLFSPDWTGYFTFAEHAQVYIGYILFIALLSGALLMTVCFLKRKLPLRHFIIFSGLVFLIVTALLLAFGTKGPFDIAPITWARRHIPMYDKMRQSAKAFIYLPLLLSATFAYIFYSFKTLFKRPLFSWGLPLLLMGVITADVAAKISPIICLLAKEQKAYQRIATESRSQGKEPHALAIPLWPGNDAWTSLYEYYASLYRIRMANGYSPIPSKKYKAFFSRFHSINQGVLNDHQLDELQKSNIPHLLLHEDAFLKKVSPFPPALTLTRLLNHPRLELMLQEQGIWAFKILSDPIDKKPRPLAPFQFPTRYYEAESAKSQRCRPSSNKEKDASGLAYLTLLPQKAWMSFPGLSTLPEPDLIWKVRMRGRGEINALIKSGKKQMASLPFTVNFPEWTWQDIPFQGISGFSKVRLVLECLAGEIDVDLMFLAKGHPPPMLPGQRHTFSASDFFHLGGYTQLENNALIYRPAHDIEETNFSALGHPLNPGTYAFELDFNVPSPSRETIFHYYLTYGKKIIQHKFVSGDKKALIKTKIPGNLPVRLHIHYLRKCKLEIKEIIITRLK